MIHTFNKNETVLEGTEYYDIVHSRDHVIVMGDSLGDAGMAAGVPSSSHILKIGFLFDHVRIRDAASMSNTVSYLYFPSRHAAGTEPTTVHGRVRYRAHRRSDNGHTAGHYRHGAKEVAPAVGFTCGQSLTSRLPDTEAPCHSFAHYIDQRFAVRCGPTWCAYGNRSGSIHDSCKLCIDEKRIRGAAVSCCAAPIICSLLLPPPVSLLLLFTLNGRYCRAAGYSSISSPLPR